MMASTLGSLNPLRYRGYVYDQETGLYYLQSRYYNPEIGRFINADGFTSTGQGLLGNNMFAYCGNNPISRYDPAGKRYFEASPYYSSGESNSFSPQPNAPAMSAEEVVRQELRTSGHSTYKGAHVFTLDLPVEGSAFSYGVIVMDTALLDATEDCFSDTLNHEYGHYIHMWQVGPAHYTKNVAIPSLITAAISDANGNDFQKWVYDHYFQVPWERIADQLGGVDRNQPSIINTLASLYWCIAFVI